MDDFAGQSLAKRRHHRIPPGQPVIAILGKRHLGVAPAHRRNLGIAIERRGDEDEAPNRLRLLQGKGDGDL